MYTDGSKTRQGAVAGFVILSGKDKILQTQNISLTDNASIFQAELIAIQEAAKQLLLHEETTGSYANGDRNGEKNWTVQIVGGILN